MRGFVVLLLLFGAAQPVQPKKIVSMVTGMFHTCTIMDDDSLECFGAPRSGQCVVPKDMGPVRVVAGGGTNTCAAAKDTGLVRCWGDNAKGQSDPPKDLGPVKAMTAGQDHVCAVKEDGSVKCWGQNTLGPVVAPKDLKAMSVYSGSGHSCAILTNGSFACFGDNQSGQCELPDDFPKVIQGALGGSYTCALAEDGELACIDIPRAGLGESPDWGKLNAVIGGWMHLCGITKKQEVKCIGSKFFNQAHVPEKLGPVIQGDAGRFHTCVLKEDSTLACWGDNASGQCSMPSVDEDTFIPGPPPQQWAHTPQVEDSDREEEDDDPNDYLLVEKQAGVTGKRAAGRPGARGARAAAASGLSVPLLLGLLAGGGATLVVLRKAGSALTTGEERLLDA